MAVPYDIIETVCNAARARLNDMIASQGGDVFTDAQPFTLVMVNLAWRRMQRRLADLGYVTLILDVISLSGTRQWLSLPPMANPDPGIFMTLTYTGCFDGNVSTSSPSLPENLIQPIKMWERPTGTASQFIEMDNIDNGLDAVAKLEWNQQFEWKSDAIFLPGATVATDLRIRYAAYLPDFTDISANPNQIVPILQCLDPFANYIASEMANSRADLDGASFDAKAEVGVQMIAQRQSSGPRSIDKDSEYGKMKDRYTPVAGGQ